MIVFVIAFVMLWLAASQMRTLKFRRRTSLTCATAGCVGAGSDAVVLIANTCCWRYKQRHESQPC